MVALSVYRATDLYGGRVLESIRMAQHQQSLAANQARALNDAVCYQTDIQYWSASPAGDCVCCRRFS